MRKSLSQKRRTRKNLKTLKNHTEKMSVRVNVCMSCTRVQNHAYVNESSRTFVRDVRAKCRPVDFMNKYIYQNCIVNIFGLYYSSINSFMTEVLIISPLICFANQWTGFCMTETSAMKELS